MSQHGNIKVEPVVEEAPAAEVTEEAAAKPAKQATRATPKSSDGKLSAREAIVKVLTGKRTPMTVTEIANEALPLTRLKGETPKQHLYSILYSENKRPDGLFRGSRRASSSSAPSASSRDT